MPNLDGTGPMGQGAITGKRRGRCKDVQTTQTIPVDQSVANNNIVFGLGRGGRPRGGGGFGQGQGQGRSHGRGLGNR